MQTLVSKEGLKSDFIAFRSKGDARWAGKADVPTDEHIAAVVETTVDELGVKQPLTEEDVDEIIAAL